MYFLLTVLLISLGVLFGIIISSSVEKSELWSAVSALGSWISGIGALAAGGIALYISYKQELRDTYKLRVNKSAGIPIDVNKAIYETKIVPTSSDVIITIDIFNYGLRPVQILEIKAVQTGVVIFSKYPPPKLVVQPGTKESITIDSKEQLTITNQFAKSGLTNRPVISTNDIYNSDMYIVDAAGVEHLAYAKIPGKH